MKSLYYFIILLFINVNVYANVGDEYFCRDTEGDLNEKSSKTLIWGKDGYIYERYFKGESNAGPKSKQKIVYQNNHSFLAYEIYSNGIVTNSFNESGNKIISIRTFIRNDHTFHQKSICHKQ